MSDKEKFVTWFRSVHDATVARPELSDADAQALADRFFDEIATVVNTYAAEAARLEE